MRIWGEFENPYNSEQIEKVGNFFNVTCLMIKRIFFQVLIISFVTGCASTNKIIIYDELPKEVDSFIINEGIISQHSEHIKYRRKGKTIAVISLSEPVIVAQAEQKERWGYYQFPVISKTDEGTLIVEWQMQDDSHESYGVKSERAYTPMMSKNGGLTWGPQDRSYNAIRRGNNVRLSDGRFLQFKTLAAQDISNYYNFPKAVAKRGNYSFYLMESLPDNLQGLYFTYQSPKEGIKVIHSKLNDPSYLRYSIDGLMPIVWWGNIKELADKSLVAGVYPAYYLESNGDVSKGSVSFYQSKDGGYTWDILSRIPFINDGVANVIGNNSFEEPAFEVLNDSTFICVMRSGATSPLYRTFSKDKGRTWTIPEPFTPNGVRPVLMSLKNGVLVLASGRPGVQLRFSFDNGKCWTDAIDMVPFMNDDGSYVRDVSCGYTSLIESDNDDDSFYIVYSDFTTKNSVGETRKTIWFRKIKIKNKIQYK